ncbi:glycoside hydrolase family protein [Aeromonas caviae]|uniref:glycoside hydrolase family protein n=1 Tax=Aeromonas caviae TaxID=648 RepID=UPI0029DA48A3|nr:glycoside hydrolase family protein [Aeromonas caviae]MDX7833843.1 glycoside hydrolase family protein [Aeromonas caviae]
MKELTIEEMLKYDEGYKLEVYFDHLGYPTCGIGHLIKRDSAISKTQAIALLDKELNRNTQGRITASECSYLFRKDLAAVQTGIAHSSFYGVYQGLDPVRQSSIQNMCFQLGILGASKFRKMWAALAKGDYSQAAKEGLDSNWFKQTPNRARRVMETLRTGSTQHYPTK